MNNSSPSASSGWDWDDFGLLEVLDVFEEPFLLIAAVVIAYWIVRGALRYAGVLQ